MVLPSDHGFGPAAFIDICFNQGLFSSIVLRLLSKSDEVSVYFPFEKEY